MTARTLEIQNGLSDTGHVKCISLSPHCYTVKLSSHNIKSYWCCQAWPCSVATSEFPGTDRGNHSSLPARLCTLGPSYKTALNK